MSDIIKSNFVSFSDQKRTIKNIDQNNPKVLQSSVRAVDAGNPGNPGNEGNSGNINDESANALQHEGEFASKGKFEESQYGDSSYANLLRGKSDNSTDFDGLSNERYSDRLDERYQGGYQQGYDVGFQEANEQGYSDGYVQGQAKAQNELDQSIEAVEQEKKLEYEERVRLLEAKLQEERRELEPKMISIIERLVKKLVGEHEMNQSTIMYLIKNGLDELELHGDLIIKVSSFDLDYVIENKHRLTENLSEKIQVEVLKDLQLNQNECIIETDMGTIDCSLGVQLQGLLKELRLIRESLLNE